MFKDEILLLLYDRYRLNKWKRLNANCDERGNECSEDRDYVTQCWWLS